MRFRGSLLLALSVGAVAVPGAAAESQLSLDASLRADGRTVDLHWSAPDDDASGDGEHRYTVVRAPGGVVGVKDTHDTSAVDVVADNGDEYTYSIVDEKSEARAGDVVATRPGAVANMRADAPAGGPVALQWSNPSAPDLGGIVVARVRGGDADCATSPGDGTDIGGRALRQAEVDREASAGERYCYSVFALDGAGNVAPRASVSVDVPAAADSPPPPVSGLVADTSTGGVVALGWELPGSDEVDGVVVQRKSKAHGRPKCPDTVEDGVRVGTQEKRSSESDGDVVAGRRYCYGVFTVDGDGNASSPATVRATATEGTTAPHSVANLRAFVRRIRGGAIELRWTNPGDSELVGVAVRRTSDGTRRPRCAEGPGDGRAIGEDSVRSEVRDGNAKAGRTYCYAVFAIDEDGDVSARAATRAVRPRNVRRVHAEAGCQSIRLTWRTPTHPAFVRIVVVRNRRHAPTGPTDGKVLRHGRGVLVDRGRDPRRRYHYALFTVFRSPNEAQPLTYSTGADQSVRTGVVCRPRDNSAVRSRTPLVDWLSRRGAFRYAILVRRAGRTILVRYPKKSHYRVRSAWEQGGRTRRLRGGRTYTAFVYAYTSSRPRGVLLGQTTFKVQRR
jgi:hypothetical protein